MNSIFDRLAWWRKVKPVRTYTGLITGLDNEEPQDFWEDPWIERPWTDNGRLSKPLNRTDPDSVHNEWYEMLVLGRPDFVAIGLRSIRDPGWAFINLKRDTLEQFRFDFEGHCFPPARICPFIDTAGFNWFGKFDLASPEHCQAFWDEWLGPYFETFAENRDVPNPIRWQRTSEDRLLILMWNNYEAANRGHARQFLASVRDKMVAKGMPEPAFILDRSWLEGDKSISSMVYGLHQWFDASVSSYSIDIHRGVKIGVTVPSFHDYRHSAISPKRKIDGERGELLRRNLRLLREQCCNYIFIESYSNLIESAGLYRTEPDGDDSKLRVLREHMEITRGTLP